MAEEQSQEQRGDGGQNNEAQEAQNRRKRSDPRRKRTVRLIVIAVLVVAIIVAIPVYSYYSVRESTDDAQVDGHVIPISSRISGNVLSVLVNDNQNVRAGQELIRLDPADYKVAVAQAEAQLSSSEADTLESEQSVPVTNITTSGQISTSVTQEQQARASVTAAEKGVEAARARLNSANAGLAQRQANYVKAQKDLERFKALVEKDEISKQDYDAAVAAADANAAQVTAGRAEVLEAEQTLDQAIAQVDEAKARLATATVQRHQSEQLESRQRAVTAARYESAKATAKQKRADLDQAKLNLDYTILRAPVDGVVTRKTAEPGIQVAAGQQLMAIVPLEDVWITANFKETQLQKMRVGQRVEIEVDAYGGSRKYRAHIDSIAAASGAKFSLLPPENATGNYVKVVQRVPVKIVLEPGENRDRRLIPGMSVVPTVLLNSDANGPGE
ncbi:MAG: HlyD family secretion protein [Bryobacteraceae bacterium]